MAQIRLAIDLDGVLTEHPSMLARAANEYFNLVLPDSSFVDSTGHAVTMAVRDWVYGPDGPATTLAVNPLAREFLRRVATRLGSENMRIITARPASSREMTLAWLAKHGLDVCEVIFADDKVSVARELGITHAIEDSIRHARSYTAAGITCYFLPIGLTVRPRGISNIVADLSEAASHIFDDARVLTTDERPTIVISDHIAESARARLAAGARIVDVPGLDVPLLHAALADADALVVRSETIVDEETLRAGPRLRVVARAGVGVDNIDVEAATRAGVLVLNAPGANAVSAAEHTIALLLSISRQIPDANLTLHAGRWERSRYRPFDLRGRTVGIVGLGRVGGLVAQRLAAFEMHILAHDPYVPAERFESLGAEAVSYEDLLRRSDIVTFHVPSTSETRSMLSRNTVPYLKRGAIVINCARGDVVDEQALADALDAGVVAAAGVDVFPHEPVTHSPLLGRPNVVLTPHIGGSSIEALNAVGDIISATTLAALRGESVPNAVNLPTAALDAGELERLTRVAGAAGHLLGVLGSSIPNVVQMTLRGHAPAEVVERVFIAALAEGLHHWTTARVTPVNARIVATEHRIEPRVVHDSPAERSTAVEFSFETQADSDHHVTVRWADGQADIVEVDRFSLDRPLSGDVLITHHRDKPGMVGRIGTILGRHEVNIAGMQVGRHHAGGDAIMVLNVDDAISSDAMMEILALDDVVTAYVVSLPGRHSAWEQEPIVPAYSGLRGH
jgi:D-3-phosphoglycerate dehydrogenase / 2-oxoglutarate reductase